MKDEEIIDELIAITELISNYPWSPPHPDLSEITQRLVQLKATRLKSKLKFLQAFQDVTKTIKQITDIKM